MSLGNDQREFTACLGKLIEWAYQNGYALSVGDGYRDPRVFGQVGEKKGYGRSKSNHKIRLAQDFNLFIWNENTGWEYQTTTEAHKPLGEYWESLHPKASWGGHFNDGNHYSFEHEGRR